jgi:hypothetical protein
MIEPEFEYFIREDTEHISFVDSLLEKHDLHTDFPGYQKQYEEDIYFTDLATTSAMEAYHIALARANGGAVIVDSSAFSFSDGLNYYGDSQLKMNSTDETEPTFSLDSSQTILPEDVENLSSVFGNPLDYLHVHQEEFGGRRRARAMEYEHPLPHLGSPFCSALDSLKTLLTMYKASGIPHDFLVDEFQKSGE